MRPRTIFLLLSLIGFSAPTAGQDLVPGDWQGHMLNPGGMLIDMTYHIEQEGGSFSGIIEAPFGQFEMQTLYGLKGMLSFHWDTGESIVITCKARLVRSGVYTGGCKDEDGRIGGILMAQPGVEATPEEMTEDQAYDVWGLTAPEAREASESPRETRYEKTERSIREAVPEGSLVTLQDSSRINVVQAGTGAVTVVFESGLGDDLRVWRDVLEETGKSARLFAYDRAGLGYSDPAMDAPTLASATERLHAVLEAAGQTPPYVLVGQGYGSMLVRRFAHAFPEDVAGLVLVHPAHEQLGKRLETIAPDEWERYWAQQKGFYKVLSRSVQDEFALFASIIESGRLEGAEPGGGIPTIVLTSMRPVSSPRWPGETAEGQAAIQALHAALAKSFAEGEQRVTTTAGPLIQLDEPALVIGAVKDIVAKVASE